MQTPATLRRSRILFFAEAVTLAHVGRMLALATQLDPLQYEVLLACDPRYKGLMGQTSIPIRDIHTIPASRFFAALDSGSPIYDADTLQAYVDEDIEVINAFKPDVVVGDFRLSLAAASRLTKVPYISVSNAYWSPYAQIRYVVPNIPLTRILGHRIAQHLFNLARPIAFAGHAKPIIAMLKRNGLPPCSSDLRDAYTRADITLYADLESAVPTAAMPANHRFIGPIPWIPHIALPVWWDEVPTDKPIVYVNLGSSGHGHLLPIVMEALERMPVYVIAGTAGRVALEHIPDNAFVADFLPGDAAVAKATIVICNGGSPTTYQALAAGRATIGVAVNLDQYLNTSILEHTGAVKLVRSEHLRPQDISSAVQTLLGSDAALDSARRIALELANTRPHALFQQALTELLPEHSAIPAA